MSINQLIRSVTELLLSKPTSPERQQTDPQLNARLVIFAAILGSIFCILIVRLVEVQLVFGQQYSDLADNNRYYTESILPDRGVILDRYGQPLVLNKRRYYQLSSSQALHSDRVAIERETALQLLATRSGEVVTANERWYPFGAATAGLLGYVGLVNGDELQAAPELTLDAQVGKFGLEKRYDQRLRGQAGQKVVEINALGQRQRTVSQRLPLHGESVGTHIDPFLTQVAYQAFGDQRGAVVVSDASSGAILALVSHPSFDANLLSTVPVDAQAKAERQTQLRELFNNPLKLFFNRVVSGEYPPGSIFKVITALAGLQEEVLDETTTVDDQGTLKVGEYEYRNWYFTQYGRTDGVINVVKALARSNDIFFYKTAEWVGPDKIAAVAQAFGLGKKPDLELDSVADGLVPTPAWKEKVIGERWSLGNTYHLGIGQDNLLLSPLQANQIIQTVANQGKLCQPSIVAGTQVSCADLGIAEEDWQLVMLGLLDACSPAGTAFPFFPRNLAARVPGQSVEDDLRAGAVACKTGTAEFGGVDHRGYRRTHGWFVMTVEPQIQNLADATPSGEVASPTLVQALEKTQQLDRDAWLDGVRLNQFPRRITITVLIESDEAQPFKEGSRDAAPVAKTILQWIEEGVQLPATADITEVAEPTSR